MKSIKGGASYKSLGTSALNTDTAENIKCKRKFNVSIRRETTRSLERTKDGI
jgi:hypothetical protein